MTFLQNQHNKANNIEACFQIEPPGQNNYQISNQAMTLISKPEILAIKSEIHQSYSISN